MEFVFFFFPNSVKQWISPFVSSHGISDQEAILVYYSNIINLKIQDISLEMAVGNLFFFPHRKSLRNRSKPLFSAWTVHWDFPGAGKAPNVQATLGNHIRISKAGLESSVFFNHPQVDFQGEASVENYRDLNFYFMLTLSPVVSYLITWTEM